MTAFDAAVVVSPRRSPRGLSPSVIRPYLTINHETSSCVNQGPHDSLAALPKESRIASPDFRLLTSKTAMNSCPLRLLQWRCLWHRAQASLSPPATEPMPMPMPLAQHTKLWPAAPCHGSRCRKTDTPLPSNVAHTLSWLVRSRGGSFKSPRELDQRAESAASL